MQDLFVERNLAQLRDVTEDLLDAKLIVVVLICFRIESCRLGVVRASVIDFVDFECFLKSS